MRILVFRSHPGYKAFMEAYYEAEPDLVVFAPLAAPGAPVFRKSNTRDPRRVAVVRLQRGAAIYTGEPAHNGRGVKMAALLFEGSTVYIRGSRMPPPGYGRALNPRPVYRVRGLLLAPFPPCEPPRPVGEALPVAGWLPGCRWQPPPPAGVAAGPHGAWTPAGFQPYNARGWVVVEA